MVVRRKLLWTCTHNEISVHTIETGPQLVILYWFYVSVESFFRKLKILHQRRSIKRTSVTLLYSKITIPVSSKEMIRSRSFVSKKKVPFRGVKCFDVTKMSSNFQPLVYFLLRVTKTFIKIIRPVYFLVSKTRNHVFPRRPRNFVLKGCTSSVSGKFKGRYK